MKRWVLAGAALVALAAGAWFFGVAPVSRATAATFHVDYEHGHDNADGLSPATAWKHAPGDPSAEGGPARTALRAGDVVTFAAHVRYRGSIFVKASGAAGAPIVFTGATPDGSAVIDGSDPVASIAPCPSAEACGGATTWRQLTRIEFAKPIEQQATLFTDGGLMRPAQGPDPKDDFYRDEVDDMAEADGKEMSTGRVTLPHAIAAGLASGGGTLVLWRKPNVISYRPILSMQGDVALFDAKDIPFYTDRPERVAVINHVSLIDHPGEYALLPDGKTAVALLPRDAKTVSVGSGRGAFHVKGASHLVFRNLGFENMSDGGKPPPAGVAIFIEKAESSDVLIENNRFHQFSNPAGQGPMIIRAVSDLKIVKNHIDTISLGSGMRLSGPAENILVEDNDISRLGRTGIFVMGVSDVIIRRNTIADVLGVHGNGMSAYLDSHNVTVVANTITNAKQPATINGAGQDATRDNNILFANNVFVGTSDSLGSLISWGNFVRGVTIRNNVLLGGKMGLRLNAKDSGVVVSDNVASGLGIVGEQPSDWRFSGNEWTQLTFQQKRDGSRISPRFATAAEQLENHKVPREVCEVIARHSMGPPAAGPPAVSEAASAVGAELRCP